MTTTPPNQQLDSESPYDHSEILAAEITELSAYIYAATARLLTLIPVRR